MTKQWYAPSWYKPFVSYLLIEIIGSKKSQATDISDSTTHSHYQNQNIDLASGVAEVFTWAVNPVSLGPPSYA